MSFSNLKNEESIKLSNIGVLLKIFIPSQPLLHPLNLNIKTNPAVLFSEKTTREEIYRQCTTFSCGRMLHW